MKSKQRYRGTFNWYGETHTLWIHAFTLGAARQKLLHKLADKLGFEFAHVSRHFNYGQAEHKIEQI